MFFMVVAVLLAFTALSYLLENISKSRAVKLMKQEHELLVRDYEKYFFNFWERLKYIGFAALVIFCVVYLFYRSVIFALIVCIASVFFPKLIISKLVEKQKMALVTQFRVALNSIDTSISSGASPTNAIIDALEDLYRTYDFDSFIIQEFEIMKYRITLNEPLEDALLDFANRSHVEDIQNFCHVFVSSLQTGGKRVEIIRSAIANIVEKMEIKKEISLMVAETKYQVNVMVVMPALIMLMLSTISPDYVKPLFNSIIGRVTVTIVLVMIGFSYYLANKIVDIEV